MPLPPMWVRRKFSPSSATWRRSGTRATDTRGTTAGAGAMRAAGKPSVSGGRSVRMGRLANDSAESSVRATGRAGATALRGGGRGREIEAIRVISSAAASGLSESTAGRRTGMRRWGETRGRTLESRANCPAGMVLAFSRRRIRLATLLASCSRSMPVRRRNWLRCSREQKSPPEPTVKRLRAFPQSWQVRPLILAQL